MSTLRAVDLIRTAAENIDGVTFITGTRLLNNNEADNVTLPVCMLIRPIRIPVEVAAGGRMIERFNCLVFFLAKSELEFGFAEHDPIVYDMKLKADQFLVNLNSFSDYIKEITNIVITDIINDYDANLTGTGIEFELELIPEAEQVCPTGTFTPEGLPTFSKYLTEVIHDDTLDGKGTAESPLTVIGGGGSNLRVQDEGTTVTNAATTINFTGAGVTASLASAGNVTVNIPASSGGAVDSVNGQTGTVVLDTDDISDTATNRYTNDTDIARLANTSGTNTGDQNLSGLVPYTGATGDVDLGANGLDAKFLRVTGTNGNGDIHLRHQATDATATGQSTSIFADANGDVKIKNDGLDYATLKTSLITDDRVYTFPDKSGTVAMTSDVEVYTEGTGIDITGNVITNTAPDQTVALTAGTGIAVTGTYPNFTIENTVNGLVRSEYTASNAASIDVPVPAGYSHHKIIMVGIVAGTANSELWHRVGIGAPSVIQSGAGAYLHYRILGGSSTALAMTGSAADTKMVLIGAAMPTGSSGQALNGNYTLYNPDSTTLKKQFNGNMTTFFNNGIFVGGTIHSAYNAADAVTSIRFQCSTGNISGKIIIESYL